MTTHRVLEPSERVIFLLTRRYDDVRFWFDAYGQLVGVWTAKNGRQYAVGHNPAGHTIVYPASRPEVAL